MSFSRKVFSEIQSSGVVSKLLSWPARSMTPNRQDNRERGAQTIELLIAIPIFLALLIAIFDFGRVVTVQNLLLKGAQDGLNVAEKIVGSEIEIRNLSATDPRYQRFLEARQEIERAALSTPKGTFLTPSTEGRGANRLVGFQYNDQLLAGSTSRHPQEGVVEAIFLRPGESAWIATGIEEGRLMKHPIPSVPHSEEWEEVLEREPIMVLLCAEVELFLRGITPSLFTCRRALGFRPPVFVAPQGAVPSIPRLGVCEGESCLAPRMWDEDSCECTCGMYCFLPKKLDEDRCECRCPESIQCPGESRLNTDTCECNCDLSCNSPYSLNAPQCRCDCDPAKLLQQCDSPEKTPNMETCSCECVRERCPNPNHSREPSTCRCGCDLALLESSCAQQGKRGNVTTCSCQCPTERCGNPNHTRDPSTCQCRCDDSLLERSCAQQGKVVNPDTCSCQCPTEPCPNPNHSRDPSTCRCECDRDLLNQVCTRQGQEAEPATCSCKAPGSGGGGGGGGGGTNRCVTAFECSCTCSSSTNRACSFMSSESIEFLGCSGNQSSCDRQCMTCQASFSKSPVGTRCVNNPDQSCSTDSNC